MAIRITCIRKDNGNHANPHEGITHFGWTNEQTRASGESSLGQMIHFFENQNGSAYVKDNNGIVVSVGIWTTTWGTKYLRTYANSKWSDNLLSLPECD